MLTCDANNRNFGVPSYAFNLKNTNLTLIPQTVSNAILITASQPISMYILRSLRAGSGVMNKKIKQIALFAVHLMVLTAFRKIILWL